MLCVDVNVLVYAHRRDLDDHATIRAWLDAARTGAETVGLCDAVASGFLRVVTNARVFIDPTPFDDALAFLEVLRASPSVAVVQPGERHWGVFVELCRTIGATGNDVPDAYLAALAIEHGATWVSADRGFARFPKLRWALPNSA